MKTPHTAWRFSPKVQHPDAPWATESGRAWITECQSHSTALTRAAPREPQAAKDRWWWGTGGGSVLDDQAPAWDISAPSIYIYISTIDRQGKTSYQWLEKASSEDSTEARITSAKERAPRSRTMEAAATTANRTQVTDASRTLRGKTSGCDSAEEHLCHTHCWCLRAIWIEAWFYLYIHTHTHKHTHACIVLFQNAQVTYKCAE